MMPEMQHGEDSVQAEIDQYEEEFENCIQSFTQDIAPKKITEAAQLVLEFYSKLLKKQGTVSIAIVDGKVHEILLVDTEGLDELAEKVGRDIATDVEDAIFNAKAKAADDLADVQNRQVGAFGPRGAESSGHSDPLLSDS